MNSNEARVALRVDDPLRGLRKPVRSPVAAHVDPAHAIVEIDFLSAAARAPVRRWERRPSMRRRQSRDRRIVPSLEVHGAGPRQDGTAKTRQAAELYPGRNPRRRPLVVAIMALLAAYATAVMPVSSAVAAPTRPATYAAPASPATYQEPYRPQFHFTPGPQLDERSQRAGLLQGGVPPVLPVQPLRRYLGEHVLGTRRQPGPGALETFARCHTHGGRRINLLRQCGCRQGQHVRLRHPEQPAHGCDLHQRASRISGTVAGLQPRPRSNVDQVCG